MSQYWPVAQLVELRTVNAAVVGSSPTWPENKKSSTLVGLFYFLVWGETRSELAVGPVDPLRAGGEQKASEVSLRNEGA